MSLAQTLLLDLECDEELETESTIELNNNNKKMSELKLNSKESEPVEHLNDIDINDGIVCDLIKDKKFLGFLNELNEINHKKDVSKKFAFDSSMYTKADLYVQEIDNELSNLHLKLIKVYSIRFPELSSLVLDPILYTEIVRELKNDINQTKYNENLPKFLPNSLIIVISISALSTKGKELNSMQLEYCDKLICLVDQISKYKFILETFVESRMSNIAPNLTNLLGSSLTTKLLSASSGLKNLINIPPCNIHLIGAEKQLTQSGSLSHSRTNGLVYESDIVLDTNPDFIKHAVRLVSNKISIASKCDFFQPSPSGVEGLKLRQTILNRLHQIQEPLSNNQKGALDKKALPVPQEAVRRRRGGRRARKAKELMGISDMRSQANKMPFGQIGDDVNQIEIGKDFGKLIGNSKSGKVRGSIADLKTKAKVSKRMQQKLNQQAALASAAFNKIGGNATALKQQLQKNNGSASSVISFTPIQGFEIISNTESKVNDKMDETGYFSSTAQFKKPKL